MANAERGHHLANFADLRENMRALFAHVETAQQAVQAHLDRTTNSDSITSDISNDVVEPLTVTRIDDIVRSVSSKVSTWADLQKQYPPNRSCLVPLSVAVGSSDASASAGLRKLDPKLEADSAYCQAATMAAYDIELLRLALDGVQVDRRRVRQTSDILAKLCATLVDSRNQCRGAGTSRLEEAAGSYGQVRDMAEAPVSVLESERAATTENARPMMDERGGRACVRVTNKRNQSYSGGLPLGLDASSGAEADSDLEVAAHQQVGGKRAIADLEQIRLGIWRLWGQPAQQLNSSDLVWEVSSTSSASLHAPESDIDDELDSDESVVDEPVGPAFTIQLDYATTSEESVDGMDTCLVTDSAPIVSATLLATGETQLVVSDSRSVIRDGLLRQGFSEPSIAAYFKQHSKGTNYGKDRYWRHWAQWCDRNDKDPLKRSVMDLEAFALQTTVCDTSKVAMRSQIKRVWSIIEGQQPPANRRSRPVSTPTAYAAAQAPEELLPAELERRSVVREGLLRQGLSELDIAAYFNQYRDCTLKSYDAIWSRWACWCAKSDRDPRRRSDVDLKAFSLQTATSKLHMITWTEAIKRVWSIIEGQPPPANRLGKLVAAACTTLEASVGSVDTSSVADLTPAIYATTQDTRETLPAELER